MTNASAEGLNASASQGSATTVAGVADAVLVEGEELRTVNILISYDVVRLLSEQLYASPVKAIEELVVNGWDAGATVCSVMVDVADKRKLAVFDNGSGMTADQLGDLWHIGISRKAALSIQRKQIGKFGIGKLASYAVARRATYITQSTDGLLAVTINFDDLVSRTDPSTGIATALPLSIRRLSGLDALWSIDAFRAVANVFDLKDEKGNKVEFSLATCPSWTIVILEDLRERSEKLAQTGRLRWVLETAMPYSSDFALYLNGDAIVSRKKTFESVVAFNVADINPKRLDELNKAGETDWHASEGALYATDFPGGIRGSVVVTDKSLYSVGGKSEDLGRSHGFFVRVHKRLVNETDPLFGARPLSFTTWYRFAAEIEADDLNQYITASRDDFEQSALKPKLRELLVALFNDARERYENSLKKKQESTKEQTESQREHVSRRLVEKPLADVLARESGNDDSIDDDWTLVDPANTEDVADLISELYADDTSRRSYKFRLAPLGPNQPFVSLDVGGASLTLNEDHPLVQEFADKPESRRLLELAGVAEAMLEAYMREADIPIETIRELLARRDLLLRSLAQDESYSLLALANALREDVKNSADSKALEISVVGALRALGFAATHVSGSKTPDGTAGYQVYGVDADRLTVEAKASVATPSLNHMDMAGLRSHAIAVNASGTMLVAPRYPGAEDPESETNLRAAQQTVSCWTAEQLAQVVESAERRHITARDVQSIVLEAFGPIEVTSRVDSLLKTPSHDRRALYREILDALGSLRKRLTDIPRNVSLIAAEVTRKPELESVSYREVLDALSDIAHVSRGLVHVTDDQDVILFGDLNELRRRVSPLTELSEEPRRRGTFRDRTYDREG